MFQKVRSRLSAPLAVAMVALFVALGGVAVAAPGDNFILGQSNSSTTTSALDAPVDGANLLLSNASTGANATALQLTTASNRAPLTVNSTTKVAKLNVDSLDNLDSTAFLRRRVTQTNNVTTAGGVVDVLNTGTTNGVQAKTNAIAASGVYGENDSGTGGFGVAGRAGNGGNAIYGDNTGNGWAGYFEDKVHVGGTLDAAGDVNVGGHVNCSGCVSAGNVSGRVNDSDKLDGIDSTGFIQGTGGGAGQAIAEGPGQHRDLGPAMLGFLRLTYFCPSALSSQGTLVISNDSGSIANVFEQSGQASTSFVQLPAGGVAGFASTPSGDMYHIQAQGGPGVLTIEAATAHRTNDCHAQAQAVLAR
jgi:hypothetical protein